MFCLVNIYYERTTSRSFYIRKGLLLIFPGLCFFIFLICAANISAPPTLNLLSEIFLILRVLRFNNLIILIFPLGSFIGAVFTLYLFRISQHGKMFFSGLNFLFPKRIEYHTLNLHLILLNFIILKSRVFFFWL